MGIFGQQSVEEPMTSQCMAPGQKVLAKYGAIAALIDRHQPECVHWLTSRDAMHQGGNEQRDPTERYIRYNGSNDTTRSREREARGWVSLCGLVG
jgi:hypothetical protein